MTSGVGPDPADDRSAERARLHDIALHLLGSSSGAALWSEAQASAAVDRVSLDESVSTLLHVVLESLTPEARVAFILHDVFGVPYVGIADAVGRSSEDARELARSARRQIQHRRKRDGPGQPDRDVVLNLLAGCTAGIEEQVRATLHPDVTVTIDGGGTGHTFPSPVRGVERAARLLIRVCSTVPAVTVSEQSVNGQTGLILRQESRVMGVLSASTKAGAILDIWIVLNPDKLGHWN